MKQHYAVAAGFSLLAIFSMPASAESATFSASKDTTLYSNSGTLSNGAGEYFFAGVTASGASRRALLAFDLSGIAPGSTIASVELTLSVASAAANAAVSPFSLYRMTADWGEAGSNAGSPGGQGTTAMMGDATWSHRFYDTQTWTTAGGDFVSTASASRTVTEGAPGAPLPSFTWGSTPELVADVQGWINNPSANYGWVLRGSGLGSGTAARFASSEYTLGDQYRPSLVVNFAPVPEPSTALLALPGLVLIGYVVKRRRSR